MMTRWIATSTLLALTGVGTAWAHGPSARGHDADDVYGRVVRVEPILRRVAVERPRSECFDGRADDAGYRIAGATLAGGVIGGAIGHQLGRGENRNTMTLLGTVVGSVIANQRAVSNEADREDGRDGHARVRRCRIVREHVVQTQVVAYRVVYTYRGGRYTMRMRERPGRRVRIGGPLVPAGHWGRRDDRHD